MAESDIVVGEIAIKVLVSNDLIESFDTEIGAAGAGPGRHFHTRMDEIFSIQSGKILVTRGDEKITATEGMIIRVPKTTPHSWHAIEGPARLLITFIPGGRQVEYLRELGRLSTGGASWEEGISALRDKYDNTPC